MSRIGAVILLLALLLSTGSAHAADADPCAAAAAARPGWTEQESWTWGRICAGLPADLMVPYAGEPAKRRLSPGFLAALIFDPALRALVPHQGLRIASASFEGRLDLANAAPGFEIAIERSEFAGDVDLHGLVDAADVSFAASRFLGRLDLDGAKLGGDLDLDATTAEDVSMRRATIAGSLAMDRIAIAKGLDLERISVAHNLSLRRSSLSGINLLAASVASDLTLDDSSIAGWAWIENLQLGSDLYLRRAHLMKTDLLNDSISGNLVMTGTTATERLNLKGTKIGGDALLDNGRFSGIVMSDADVGYGLRLDGSHVSGPLMLAASHVGHLLSLGKLAVFDDEVDANYAKIDGGAILTGAQFAGDVLMNGVSIGQSLSVTGDASIAGRLRMTFAHVGANVDLTGGRFNAVDLTGTSIGAEIRLASKGLSAIAWSPAGRLTLRNVDAKALQDLPEAWPAVVDLEGFTYQQLGGYHESEGTDVGARDATSFVDWLAKQKQYSPQPYRTLAGVLRNSGYPEKARAILYAGNMRAWQGESGLVWWYDALRWAIIGFGVYPERSALWILVLVPLGAIVFGFEPTVRFRAMRPVDRLMYSFDALLPFITLRQEHNSFDLQAWPKYYLYFHKVMGYVLIAFLLAALTGGG
jgi:hypothetical protein